VSGDFCRCPPGRAGATDLHGVRRPPTWRAAIDRYLRAFEAQRLPESTCAVRLAELDREVRGLEARAAALDAECDVAPTMAPATCWPGSGAASSGPSPRAPEHLKQLLAAVVDRIQVESRACIQPYFVAPTVRMRIASRRRTTKHTNTDAPGPMLWVNARGWGHAG
jgi:hypothetical protein